MQCKFPVIHLFLLVIEKVICYKILDKLGCINPIFMNEPHNFQNSWMGVTWDNSYCYKNGLLKKSVENL